MTNTPREENPQRSSRASVRSFSAASLSGVNLLNSGAISVGYAQVTRTVNATHTTQAYSHHSEPARCGGGCASR